MSSTFPTEGEPVPADGQELVADDTPPGRKTRRRRGFIIAISLLAALLIAAVTTIVIGFIKLDELSKQLDEHQEIIEEQREIIEKKEIFGAAVTELLDTARAFEGVPLGTLVPFDSYETEVRGAWDHRWDPAALDRHTANIQASTEDLNDLLAAAEIESATNSTATRYEKVIDELGVGFVTSVLTNATKLCAKTALACVISDDPYTVHFDKGGHGKPYMTNWLRSGIAYHEFAHVLQFTNPEPTETALKAFKGNMETMADCFALSYLKGWTLDHRIWVNSSSYWDVSIGYGHVCDSQQKKAVREWYEQLGIELRPIAQ